MKEIASEFVTLVSGATSYINSYSLKINCHMMDDSRDPIYYESQSVSQQLSCQQTHFTDTGNPSGLSRTSAGL